MLFRIEENLLLKQEKIDISLFNVIEEYYKEVHMLISNIHLTHVLMKENIGKVFPLETNLYDGSWYKNIMVASNLIFDRLHMIIDEKLPYDQIFKDKSKCDFRALANVWNKINFIVKYNLPESVWNEKLPTWNLVATARKIEELIANKVDINLSLLEAISFDLNKYKSIPKTLVEKEQHNYQDLVDTLKGQTSTVTAPTAPSTGFGPNAQNTTQAPTGFGPNAPVAPQQAPTPAAPVETPTTPTKQRTERGPVNPYKKELDAIIRWIPLKEEAVKAYAARKKMGYDPLEYKAICEFLPIVQKEIGEINDLLANTKVKVPVDPLKAQLDKIVRWCNAKEKEVKLYRRNKLMKGESLLDSSATQAPNATNVDTKQSLRSELELIVKALDKITNEINLVDQQLNYSKTNLPKDPKIKELRTLLRWVEAKQEAVNIYKRNLRQRVEPLDGETNEDLDELKRIEKEMALLDKKLVEINKEMNLTNIPLDDLATSIASNDANEYSRAKRLAKWIDRKERDLLLLQKKLTNKLNTIREYDEEILRFRADFENKEHMVNNNITPSVEIKPSKPATPIKSTPIIPDTKLEIPSTPAKETSPIEEKTTIIPTTPTFDLDTKHLVENVEEIHEINKEDIDLKLQNNKVEENTSKTIININETNIVHEPTETEKFLESLDDELVISSELVDRDDLIDAEIDLIDVQQQEIKEELLKLAEEIRASLKEEDEQLQTKMNDIKQEVVYTDNEIGRSEDWKQKINEDEIDKKVDEINSELISLKDQISKAETEINQNESNIIDKKREVVKAELHDISDELISLKEQYDENNISDDELEEQYRILLKKYSIEADILRRAFEVLPDELRKSANSQIPEMIELLIESDLIVKKDDDKSKNTENSTKKDN